MLALADYLEGLDSKKSVGLPVVLVAVISVQIGDAVGVVADVVDTDCTDQPWAPDAGDLDLLRALIDGLCLDYLVEAK